MVRHLTTRSIVLSARAVAVLVAVCMPVPVSAQFALRNDLKEYELSESVEIRNIPNEASAHLLRVDGLLAGEKWDEAVETLRSVAGNFGEHVIDVGDQHYLSVREYCQMRLSGLAAEGLDLYRRRVDAVAETWYERGISEQDPKRLHRIVDRFFCSSVGDDALLWLGDHALEKGRYDEARWYWERISPVLRMKNGLSAWYGRLIGLADGAGDDKQPRGWLVYPDTDIDLSSVRARLILASIMQDAVERARWELDAFKALHPSDEGHLAGRTGRYHKILEQTLEQHAEWPDRPVDRDWRTFAGDPRRSRPQPTAVDIAPVPRWQIDLAKAIRPNAAMPELQEPPQPSDDFKIAPRFNEAARKLGFHPLVVGNLVLFNSSGQVFAFSAETGEPALTKNGRIYPSGGQAPLRDPDQGRGKSRFSQPRYTMTAYKDRLFVRIGTQVTARAVGSSRAYKGNRLVCLDLKKQGAIKWEYPRGPENEQEYDRQRWAFEGPPLTDGDGVYVAMRRSESLAQSHAACFDFESGELRWRRKICTADTPIQGRENEITHNLITLMGSTLYLNTNLGAIAAIRASDGHVRWIHKYPRAKKGNLNEPPPRFFRDLNPCIYYQGLVIAAPSDSHHLFALDAGTGQRLWRARPEGINPIHLLGVGNGNLIATGKSVLWYRVGDGDLAHAWPSDDRRTLTGFGRGLLAGGNVYWPTRERIYVFDQRVIDNGSKSGVLQQPSIELRRPDIPAEDRAESGNLVIGNGMLLIAGEKQIHGFPLRKIDHGN